MAMAVSAARRTSCFKLTHYLLLTAALVSGALWSLIPGSKLGPWQGIGLSALIGVIAGAWHFSRRRRQSPTSN